MQLTTSKSLAPTWSRLLHHAIAHATCFDVLSLHLYITYIFVSGLANATPPLVPSPGSHPPDWNVIRPWPFVFAIAYPIAYLYFTPYYL